MDYIDIVIPVRNEEKNIWPLVSRVNLSLEKARIDYQIIFIDDHSTDRTVEVINSLRSVFPIQIFTKQGKQGKAYSILEGASYAKGQKIVMIDADLQYPPEAIPQMLTLSKSHGVVVANRAKKNESILRNFLSRGFSKIFGKFLHNLDCDVQSGLKILNIDILKHIDKKSITPWTLDLSILKTAQDLGYLIGGFNIKFDKRLSGRSKVNVLKTTWEIGLNSLLLKIKRKTLYTLEPTIKNTMIGAGLIHKQKRMTTHTTLPHYLSAFQTFTLNQKLLFFAAFLALVNGLLLNAFITALIFIALLTFIYFIDVIFNLFVILKSLHFPPEISIPQKEISNLENMGLPIYTILCPLYREANVLPNFLKSIDNLNYPKDKLDVILLLEEDDKETINKASAMEMPSYVRTLIVPDSQPKTKPKACNYGLNFARGEYLVIYDAEDRPEPDQLLKAYLAFQKLPKETVCLQAKLNYFNPHQNLLTRFFTAEYSLWFDIVLTGLQSIGTTIPLGGTSNHFKTQVLRDLEGWDPFNVTEDCDLGIRLFKFGLKTAVIDSITLEEANSNFKNWIRQRSRWIKGYMQTYLVHMRNPIGFIKNYGIHALIFQLVIGARISFMLINPFLWLTTIAYFTLYQFVGPQIESLFPSIVFYMAAFSLMIGNFVYIYNYMIGCTKRGHYSLIKYVYLIPLYWIMASIASYVAIYQLIVKPHYWEKTIHGLDKIKKDQLDIPRLILKPVLEPIRYLAKYV
ncbi:MAG: hypothetical protein ACD_30C00056G0009 [uncultured bacterium]|uniref:Glycosyltransferase, group 2 family protein n=4 Tax=Candidatus Daviesiibacteriota TaxID=1752718 RepID=A0A0G0HAV4_9BACT|nr:MAG: hypothetical protein ACD_30C00056G0009 [uncultured bacterium]KKQ09214.1 MAG: Glycosyltransferase, group 2 family protein [Candidatus Daviesbacteria bacterium GW2011_GWB1_36_5]KKQ14725.1 MAG: Glycosyltransferase, group 2 family protein [Candidatus Daviesbacteria bacterium GW2011_GWA1_36_8]OGE17055.1 MAG: hypothetical protein A2858_01485 [Candidatus Daviesbacteria bacterium RIFCSPHIGHO2_01_FULL_36_37]OGE32688.1 MAG: hypothetical protein A3C99_03190 [Candidatus Daviesbacteria bacterium RIF